LIVVNPTTRQFSIPGADLVFGVTADSNSAIKHFQCPRYVGNNVDIASSFVRINYQNAHGEIDFYLVKDVTVTGDNVTFSWELHPKVTMYKGNVSFVMCVTGPDMKVKWHTTLGRGQVLEGLEPDSTLVETETADGIAALLALVDAQTKAVADTGAEWVRNVQFEGTDQIVAVQTAGEESKAAAVAEIEAKGKNVMESIPDDYTSLGNAVDGLIRGRAGAIVCEVEGSAVAVNDASNLHMQGLRIFGRSTQDGTPIPEAPVEIVSVDSPVVMVTGRNLLALPYRDGVSKNHGGVTYTVNPDGSVHAVGTVTATSSHFILNAVDFGEQNISEGFSNGKYHWADCLYNGSNKYTMIYLVKGVEVDKTFYPRVSLGTVPSEFETPREVQAVETTLPLRGIPVTTGGNYTDENGQQWVCDEVNLERGVYVQRIGSVVFTEDDVLSTQANTIRLRRDISSINQSKGWCSITDNYVYNATLDTVHYYITGSNCWVFVPIGYDLNANRVELLYQFATPIETPLSETEIAAYRDLHTNKPNTTIINDSGAHMKVEYAADTKLYIDNKLAALVGNT
jgi:hypothetical protein